MTVQDDYLQLLDLVYHVAKSLEGKKSSDPRMHDCNQLATKLFFHSASIYWLRQGTKAPVALPEGVDFFDFPSVAVIARSALETYLTMFEVFFENVTDDEREFRHAIWKLSGFAIREERSLQDIVPRSRRIESERDIDELRTRIENTAVFQSLSDKQKKQALQGKRWPASRPFKERLRKAGFAPETVFVVRRYLSAFVHSDGLAGAQTVQVNTASAQMEFVEALMRIVMVVLARMIREYKEAFPSAKAWYLAKPRAAHLADVYSGAGALLDLLS